MRRSCAPAFVLALALTACFQSQHAATEAITSADCATCHIELYNANPTHPGQKPITCADCHTTDDWGNAGHPEPAFPIAAGAHGGIRCTTCHIASLGSPVKGANTDCVQCHTQADMDPHHTQAPGYAYDSAHRNFCLTCHPSGRNQFVAPPGSHGLSPPRPPTSP